MLKNILLGTLLSVFCASAFAGTDELDQDKANQSIQGTVVLRVDQRTGEVSMLQVNNVVETKAEAKALENQNFQAVPKEKILSELDREAGASSWYWYYPGYNYGNGYGNGYGYGDGYGYGSGYGYGYGYNNPYYYSYGHCYNPWYSYAYGPYAYYYYNRYSYYR